MLKFYQDTHYQFREEIRKLYLETCSEPRNGSLQNVDVDSVDAEIKLTYEEGMMMVAVDDTQLTGALFVYPLSYDAGFIKGIKDVEDKVHTPYIAEMMIKDCYREQGLGRRLLLKTLTQLRKNRFKEVFIQVLDKNRSMLNLYTNSGFQYVGKIWKTHWLPEIRKQFTMEKLYLHRSL